MNFLWFALAVAAFIAYVLSPPPLWVALTLIAVMALSGVMLYVS